MVPKDQQHEQTNVLVDFRTQIKQLTPAELETQSKIEVPFKLALPEHLPSSFIYCGDMLSRFQIVYNVSCNFIGLKHASGPQPDGTLLFSVSEII